jgi:hypothetical protein
MLGKRTRAKRIAPCNEAPLARRSARCKDRAAPAAHTLAAGRGRGRALLRYRNE